MSIKNDSQGLEELRLEGLPLGEFRWVTHFFSFPLNREGAMAAYNELTEGGWPEVVTDEELEGDNYWHIAAFQRQRISADSIAATRKELEELAARHGGGYDGWDLTWRLSGRPLPPDRPNIRSPSHPHEET
jgi:regulator of ribonuclease activity B